MQKIVIINRGIPASGKSTFTQKIVSTLQESGISAVSCSTDDYFMAGEEYLFDTTKLREYHLKNQDRFKSALKDGIEMVICDNTNIEPWETKPYYEMAKEFDYRVILMDFEPRNIEQHTQAQTNEGYSRNIPTDILTQMHQSYQNYKELTAKNSYPSIYQNPKREYDELSEQVIKLDEASEPFYYDDLIRVTSKDYVKIKDTIGNLILKKMRDYSLDEIKLIPQHYKTIMIEFQKRADKSLTAYDLEDKLGKSPKQIERYIEELQCEFHNIIDIKIGRKKGYRLIDSFDIFIEAFNSFKDLDELLYLAQESNPELFRKMEYQKQGDESPYLFRSSIFEKVENRDIFNRLKVAIKYNEYRVIKFFDEEKRLEVKCIKIAFVDNNWYLVYVDSKDILKLGRISFIEEMENATKVSYQKRSIKKHLDRLNANLQNSMTLFDIKPKTATLKATPSIAKYFEKNMKKFLSSQEYKKIQNDGSVLFTLEYTQELEIFPFIQKWMPDLIILEPQSLKDAYIKKLNEAILNHS